MKAIYLVLPLSVLLLTSACGQPDKISKEGDKPKTEAVQQESEVVINSEDPKFKALEPYGPKDYYDLHIKYTRLSNPEYIEMTAYGGLDNGHYIGPFARYSLFKKDNRGIFNIVTATNDYTTINRVGADKLQCWNSIVYEEQVRQAADAVNNKIKSDYNPELLGAYEGGIIKELSASKLLIPMQSWTEWKDSKKNRTLRYEVILEKDSKANWVIRSVEARK